MNLRTTTRATLRDGAAIAIAMAVMNVATYGFTILAARMLGPAEYGALAAVMGLLLVVNVLSLGLQATGADGRLRAGRPAAHRAEVLATSYQARARARGGHAWSRRPSSAVLHLDSWPPGPRSR